MSERIDYKAYCDEITRICAKLDEYIRNFPSDKSNQLDSDMDMALSQAIGELHILEESINDRRTNS